MPFTDKNGHSKVIVSYCNAHLVACIIEGNGVYLTYTQHCMHYWIKSRFKGIILLPLQCLHAVKTSDLKSSDRLSEAPRRRSREKTCTCVIVGYHALTRITDLVWRVTATDWKQVHPSRRIAALQEEAGII